MAITLNRSDLDFLLRQVTINYLKPDPNNPGQFIATDIFNYSALANALDPSGLREVSGANNNLVGGFWDPTANGGQGAWIAGPNTTWGQASQPFLNLSVGQTSTSAPVSAYNDPGTAVTDASPRLISSLVSTMYTSGEYANPAVIDVATNGLPGAEFAGLTVNGTDTAFVANAGVLGGGRYNGWFVAFGQFFDHGLDFVNRDTDSNAKIYVKLSPNDPLYADAALGADHIPGTADDYAITLTRAAVANAGDAGGDGIFGTGDDALHSAGADGILGNADDIYSKPQFINQTGLLIDQSQTYGSHQSVNALIREYDASGNPTGRVVSGNTAVLDTVSTADDVDAKGLATWADIKTNALRIGIELIDPGINPSTGQFTSALNDLTNAPVLRVDPTGRLLFTPDGGSLWRSDSVVIGPQAADDPFVRNADGTVMRTGQNMLIDFNLFIDTDTVTPGVQIDMQAALDAHIITGDGRANENIGLTSVHHVFHEEHNSLVVNIKTTLLKEALLANDLTVLNGTVGDPSGGWTTTAIAAGFGNVVGVAGLAGNAAAIETFFANQGAVDAALASISWNGERLFQAARLITESEYNHIAIDQYIGTLYGALPEFVSYSSDINPGVSLEFSQAVFRLGHSMLTETFAVTDPNTGNDLRLLDMFLNPTLYQEIGPQALAQGLTLTLGNEVDEFVTPALQQSLLGQPLDLATINIARGRDVNLPTWNEFRDQLYKQYIQNTNNTNSSALAPYTSWADVFDHLKNPLTGVNFIAAYARGDGNLTDGINPLTDAIIQARIDYENGAVTIDVLRDAAQALYDAYLNASDLNHDEALAFMEGAPFFNTGTGQWEFTGADQGFWDIDLWIGGLAERPLFDGPLGTTFSYVILDFAQRQQDGDRFYYLYRTPMGTNLGDEIINNQFNNLVMENTGLLHVNGEVFIREDARFELDGIDTDGAGLDVGLTDVDANSDINDYFNAASQIITYADGTTGPASAGHIVVAGNEGHDFIIAGLGDDTVYGDDGNDTIQGGQGNDHLFGGAGDDLILDDENDDFISGGAGNDRIFAGAGVLDTLFGDEGDDELHGGDGIDEVIGGPGDDLLYGDGDTDVLFGGEGNDFAEGGDSVDEIWTQEGNDWLRGGVGDDHLNGGAGNDLLEGGVGAAANDGDRLIGEGGLDFGIAAVVDTGFDVGSYEDVNIAITANLDTSNQNGTGGLLDTYAGIDGLVGSRFNDNLTGADTATITSNGVNNLLVGGGGDDVLTGLGGDDQIFGDSVTVKNDLSVYLGPASGYTTITNWKNTGDDRPDFAAQGGLGHFLGEPGVAGAADKVVFSGNWADYTITEESGGFRLVDTRGIDSTAVGDFVKDVELFQFADGTRTAAQLFNQAPTDIQWNATVPGGSLPGNGLLGTLATVDPDNTTPFTYSTTSPSPIGFTLNPTTGAITRTGGNLGTNQTYTFNLRTTDAGGKTFDETIRILTGNGSSNTLNGNNGDDIIYANGNNDTLNGLGGNDTLFGQSGNDTLDGGDGNDVLNGGGGTDTATYATATAGVAVSLAITTQQDTGGSGLDTLASIENLTGSASADTLTGNAGANTIDGGAGIDTLNGGAGGDILIGGAGADTIDTGAANDNVRDLIRMSVVADYGDTVSNFDANNTSSDDRVEFGGALATTFNDGGFANFTSINFAQGNNGGGTVNANITATTFFGPSRTEALLLSGAGAEGVANADLSNAALVAAAFNAEFVITSNNGDDALLVINDTGAGNNDFAVYQWVQANAGGGNEIDATELTLIGIYRGNATADANNFGLF